MGARDTHRGLGSPDFERDPGATPRGRRSRAGLLAALTAAVCGCACRSTQEPPKATLTHGQAACEQDCDILASPELLAAVLAYEDTDADRRITRQDEGARWFSVPLRGGGSRRIVGTYALGNLVQELFLAHESERPTIPWAHVDEPVADRVSRLIRERYWDALTRRIGPDRLHAVLRDEKTDPQRRVDGRNWPPTCTQPPLGLPQFLWVPHGDEQAFAYYAELRDQHPSLVVCRLPETISAEWVRDLSANAEHGSFHGLLSLAREESSSGLVPVPYGVPGGRFNEIYGWDSYFHVRGLLQDGRVPLAQAIVDNLLYELRHYGKIPNANRTYYLTRSQPPLTSSAVRALWRRTGTDRDWLRRAVADLSREYEQVWNAAGRLTPLCQPAPASQGAAPADPPVCLATYHGSGIGEPPEVEPGHFDWLYRERAERLRQEPQGYRRGYLRRELPPAELDALDQFFLHDRCMRESGHDTTYRFTTEDGDRCADFATVDLNALLFKVELDLATLSQELRDPTWHRWCARAEARKGLILEHLYDGELFYDYRLIRDANHRFTRRGELSGYQSATTLYPLWAGAESPCTQPDGLPLRLLDQEQARRLVTRALELLEAPGGLTATTAASVQDDERATQRQWDYPFGWAPHQILAWDGLRRYGFHQEADRLTYRWLLVICRGVHDYHGTIPEKYDVVRRSHRVFAEYGNVGTDFSYITREGFGWMNASFQLGRAALGQTLINHLNALTPPERVPELLGSLPLRQAEPSGVPGEPDPSRDGGPSQSSDARP